MAKDPLIGWTLTKDATMKLVQLASRVRLLSDSTSLGSLASPGRTHTTFCCPTSVYSTWPPPKVGQLPSTIGTTD